MDLTTVAALLQLRTLPSACGAHAGREALFPGSLLPRGQGIVWYIHCAGGHFDCCAILVLTCEAFCSTALHEQDGLTLIVVVLRYTRKVATLKPWTSLLLP